MPHGRGPDLAPGQLNHRRPCGGRDPVCTRCDNACRTWAPPARGRRCQAVRLFTRFDLRQERRQYPQQRQERRQPIHRPDPGHVGQVPHGRGPDLAPGQLNHRRPCGGRDPVCTRCDNACRTWAPACAGATLSSGTAIYALRSSARTPPVSPATAGTTPADTPSRSRPRRPDAPRPRPRSRIWTAKPPSSLRRQGPNLYALR
jgi:hypothetical protein